MSTNDENEKAFESLWKDTWGFDPDRSIEARSARVRQMLEIVQSLEGLENLVWSLRWDPDKYDPERRQYENVAQQLGLTVAEVKAVESSIFAKLKSSS